jgi:hypothetical protein
MFEAFPIETVSVYTILILNKTDCENDIEILMTKFLMISPSGNDKNKFSLSMNSSD